MKGRLCKYCNSISPYHEATCRQCHKMLTYIKIEDAKEYEESEFSPLVKREKTQPTKQTPEVKVTNNNPNKGCGWLALFLLMVVALPATFALMYFSCMWGSCNDVLFILILGFEFVIAIVALVNSRNK